MNSRESFCILNTGERTRKYEVEADDGDACPHDRSVMGINGHLDITSARRGHQAKWNHSRRSPFQGELLIERSQLTNVPKDALL
jgi:hypothetical protein